MRSIQWLPCLHQEMTIGQPNIHLTIGFFVFPYYKNNLFWNVKNGRFKKGCFYRSYGIKLCFKTFSKKSTKLLIFYVFWCKIIKNSDKTSPWNIPIFWYFHFCNSSNIRIFWCCWFPLLFQPFLSNFHKKSS